MIERDFHGWKLEAAIQEIHNIVGQVRARGKAESVKIITGRGVIRGEALALLSNYGLQPVYEWSGMNRNDGAIVVVVE